LSRQNASRPYPLAQKRREDETAPTEMPDFSREPITPEELHAHPDTRPFDLQIEPNRLYELAVMEGNTLRAQLDVAMKRASEYLRALVIARRENAWLRERLGLPAKDAPPAADPAPAPSLTPAVEDGAQAGGD
jgi:hypothetical protein